MEDHPEGPIRNEAKRRQEDFTLNKVQLIKSIERDGGERLAKKNRKGMDVFYR